MVNICKCGHTLEVHDPILAFKCTGLITPDDKCKCEAFRKDPDAEEP